MKQYTRLLLDVWREVCRHLEIGESVERVASLMARRMPVKLILVRHVDVKRSLVDTVADWSRHPGKEPPQPRSICTAEGLKSLLMWCKQARIFRGLAPDANAQLPGLVPAGLPGEILAGPLNTADGEGGLLLLEARSGQTFKPEHEELL